MNDLLIVFNTCGISDNDNTNSYITNINSLLNQKFRGKYRLVISGCLQKPHQKNTLQSVFGNKIGYSWINEKLTVNTTFNKTVQESFKKYGGFNAVLYVDSGCGIDGQEELLQKNYDLFIKNDFGMMSVPTNTDTAFPTVYGWSYPPHVFITPVGKSHNLHFQFFHPAIYDNYDQKMIPDIFASFCTESTFSFMTAAIHKRWAISNIGIVNHYHGMDGASSGFGHGGWTHLIPGSRTIHEIIRDPEGTACGFGYEECNGIKMHNKSAYDETGQIPLYPGRLRNFIRKNIFLPESVLNYNNIKCEFIK